MRRISSKWTFFYKRVFPVIWFGFLLVFFAVSLSAAGRSSTALPIPFLIVPVAMMLFGFFFMKKLVFDLVDEVWDDGSSLVVRNGGREQRIDLREIKNVNYSPLINPPRVVLSLRHTTIFGDAIAFCAPVRFIPFSGSPLIDDLIDRTDVARQQKR